MASTVEDTRAGTLIMGLVESVNAHDVEQLLRYCAHHYEGFDVSQPKPQVGREGARRALQMYFSAFPDLRIVQYEALRDGDRAVLVWTVRGTHLGTIMQIPPTGRTVTVRGTSLFHLERGKVRRAEHIWDVAAMLRELGLLPEL